MQQQLADADEFEAQISQLVAWLERFGLDAVVRGGLGHAGEIAVEPRQRDVFYNPIDREYRPAENAASRLPKLPVVS